MTTQGFHETADTLSPATTRMTQHEHAPVFQSHTRQGFEDNHHLEVGGLPGTVLHSHGTSKDEDDSASSCDANSNVSPTTIPVLPGCHAAAVANSPVVERGENDSLPPPTSPNTAAAAAAAAAGPSVKLYDREVQTNMLREAFFRRWPAAGTAEATTTTTEILPEFVIISGHSGTGKSFLARQLMHQLVLDNFKGAGTCVLGKFDQLYTSSSSSSFQEEGVTTSGVIPEPYSAFVAAFTQLAQVWQQQHDDSVLQDLYVKLNAAEAGGVEDEVWTGFRALIPALECVFCPPNHNNNKQQLLGGVEQAPPTTPTSKQQQQQRRQSQTNNSLETQPQHQQQQEGPQTAFKTFIQTVFSPSEPLVILIDDLQWADLGSLELLEALTSDPDLIQCCMVIGICRSNEVPCHHNFACMLRRLEDEKGTKIVNVQVHNLSLQATAELVAHVLYQPIGGLREGLARVIHDKTQGNVYFVLQILKALYDEGVLVANDAPPPATNHDSSSDGSDDEPEQHREWTWHDNLWEEHFQAKDITVVDLILRQMKRLPEACQTLLKIASCIGAQFDQEILIALLKAMDQDNNKHGSNTNDYRDVLRLVFQQDLLISTIDRGKLAFAHDSVQEAAYALIPEEDCALVHLSIGRALLGLFLSSELNYAAFDLDDHIFLVVNQLVRGGSLLESEEDKRVLADLCLKAGRKAMTSSDFRMATQYFRLGITFLPGRPWRDEYFLCLELHTLLAEAQYCVTEFDAMDSTIDELLANARNEQDKFRAYSTKCLAHSSRLQLQQAIDLGVDVLSKYGEKMPRHPSLVRILIRVVRTKMRLSGISDDDILNLPTMSSEHEDKAAAMKTLHLLQGYTFLARPSLFPHVTLKCVDLSMKYGLCAISSGGFIMYAMLLLAFDDIDGGYRYGKLAMRLLEEKFKETKDLWLTK